MPQNEKAHIDVNEVTLEEFLRSPELLSIYTQWRNNPGTKLVINLLKQLSIPADADCLSASSGNVDVQKAAARHQQTVARFGLINMMQKLDQLQQAENDVLEEYSEDNI